MAHSIYDERNEPRRRIPVYDADGQRVGWHDAMEGMQTRTGNLIEAVRFDGLRIMDAETGRSRIYRETEITLEVARAHGFAKSDDEMADELIARIAECPHLNALHRFERLARPVWRRLIKYRPDGAHKLEGGTTTNFDTRAYYRVMAAYARQMRKIHGHPEVDVPGEQKSGA
jgi:hypothetical protein